MPALAYDRRYNIGLFGIERLHPFDSRKYGRAWRELLLLRRELIQGAWLRVDRPANDRELLLAHTSAYLSEIRHSAKIANAIEITQLRRLPSWVLRWAVSRPMRWATRGTVLALRAALNEGVAINLGGGFHHAKPDRGEGFCLYSDIAIAVRELRTTGEIQLNRRIAYVDLDAHQGNGVCHQFREDRNVFIFDMYNSTIYPWYDVEVRRRIDCNLPLARNCTGEEYLRLLTKNLPGFLDSVSGQGLPVGIYNAGTDVVIDDPLGQMSLTPNQILDRDLFVVDEFRRRGIPVVYLTSGGYTRRSYSLIANSVVAILDQSA